MTGQQQKPQQMSGFLYMISADGSETIYCEPDRIGIFLPAPRLGSPAGRMKGFPLVFGPNLRFPAKSDEGNANLPSSAAPAPTVGVAAATDNPQNPPRVLTYSCFFSSSNKTRSKAFRMGRRIQRSRLDQTQPANNKVNKAMSRNPSPRLPNQSPRKKAPATAIKTKNKKKTAAVRKTEMVSDNNRADLSAADSFSWSRRVCRYCFPSSIRDSIFRSSSNMYGRYDI